MRRKRDSEFPENGFEMWGGYMNAKIAKLDEQYDEMVCREENKSSNIFCDVSIFVNGYTNPSADQLKCLMSEHGGTYHHYFRSSKTKFIIASNLPDTKVRLARLCDVKNLPSTKIVKPEWITDCIKAGVLLDFKDYLLYSNHSKTQPRLNFKNNHTPNEVIETISTSDTFDNIDVIETTSDIIVNSNKNNEVNIVNKPIADAGSTTARTANDPNFLGEFYNNSRLHHISQLGATFKQYINDLRSASNFSFPARQVLQEKVTKNLNSDSDFDFNPSKVIMHIDMDCFFVSVGLRNHPHLKGKPVAVTHARNTNPSKENERENLNKRIEFDMYVKKKKLKMKKFAPDTIDDDNLYDYSERYGSMSEIASCSYEARALGLRNGMFMGAALRLCPDLKTIPYDFDGYKEVAYTLYDTVAQYTLDIEAVSCDEMYVDCTSLLNNIKMTPMEFATLLREEIQNKTNCSCSTGFGQNRLQARMATKKAKPNGQYHLTKDDVESYFSDILLADLPGVGRQMQYKLKSLGFVTCESLRLVNLNFLKKNFGNKTGQLLYEHCRGRDSSVLQFNAIRKSISAGVNYGIRFQDDQQCETFLRQLCEEIHTRMLQNKVIGRTITFKVMVRAAGAPVETAKFMGHGVCDNINKTVNLLESTNNPDVIMKEILEIKKSMNVKPEEMRGISIQMSKLENSEEIKNIGIRKFICSNNKQNKSNILSKKENTNDIPKSHSNEVNFSNNDILDVRSDDLIDEKNNHGPHESKLNTNSIENKSKILNLGIRKRGRPPKNSPKENLVQNDFKKIFASKETSFDRDNDIDFELENIDRDVFNALPDDIKEEVLMNCKVKRKTKNIKQPIRNVEVLSSTNDNRDVLPAESNSYIKHSKEILSDVEFNIFNLDWKEVKEILRVWINSGTSPLSCDIKLINTYFQHLITKRKIEDARYLLIFVYSASFQTHNCEWHQVYTKMMNCVQDSMIGTYGKKMLIFKKYLCCDNK